MQKYYTHGHDQEANIKTRLTKYTLENIVKSTAASKIHAPTNESRKSWIAERLWKEIESQKSRVDTRIKIKHNQLGNQTSAQK